MKTKLSLRPDEYANIQLATHFTVARVSPSGRTHEQYEDFHAARAALQNMVAQAGCGPRPCMYAVAGFRTVFVPDDYPAAYPNAVHNKP
jgi:hypothetical protein